MNKPVVVLSDCLRDRACRYNGQAINDPLVASLAPHVRFVPVCPEVAIGLGTPRDPIRIEERKGNHRLVQPETGDDLSSRMRRFARGFVAGLEGVDGFLLKGKSPSCGVRDAKIYAPGPKAPVRGKGAGFFAEEVLRRFPRAAVEDEGRLTNFTIREHFLTRLFTSARFRRIVNAPTMGKLVRFQASHKLLLMAYRETSLRAMGRLVANLERRKLADVLRAYEEELGRALSAPLRRGPVVNVFQHAFGYVSKGLGAREKRHFEGVLEKYRRGKVPASAVGAVLRTWILRAEVSYLEDQVFFEPYPEELIEITDSGKGRDY